MLNLHPPVSVTDVACACETSVSKGILVAAEGAREKLCRFREETGSARYFARARGGCGSGGGGRGVGLAGRAASKVGLTMLAPSGPTTVTPSSAIERIS